MLQRPLKVIILTGIFVFVLNSTARVALAKQETPVALAKQDAPWVYFPETGHTVRTPFLEYYQTRGGFARFGYPITDAFVDPRTRLIVQYFEKARLEWHPANPDPYKIQLGLLGEELGKRTPPILVKDIPPAADPSCAYFGETGHTVCYKFLEYWRAGGLDTFGYPITEYLYENGVIVQYFQRAKMEWQPSKPLGQQIQLAAIGEVYAKAGGVPAERLKPQPPDGEIFGPTSIQARGSVLNGFTPPGGSQSAYVLVTDQLGRPVYNAAVSLIVHYPAPKGNVTYLLAPTDKQGETLQTFDAGTAAPGIVISIEFIVTYPGLEPVHAPTSYLIWYN